jgi:hypothetical protein
LKTSGEDLLQDPELNRINGEIRGTVSEGSRAIYRMGLLAALHYGDGDLKWKDRAVRELLLLCDKTNFRDWHPVEAQAVADMVIAVTLGYDWFRDGLTAPQATEVRAFLEQKGVDALIAHLNEEPPPATAFGTAPGATETAKKKADPKKAKGKPDKAEEAPVNSEQMAIASALLIEPSLLQASYLALSSVVSHMPGRGLLHSPIFACCSVSHARFLVSTLLACSEVMMVGDAVGAGAAGGFALFARMLPISTSGLSASLPAPGIPESTRSTCRPMARAPRAAM